MIEERLWQGEENDYDCWGIGQMEKQFYFEINFGLEIDFGMKVII